MKPSKYEQRVLKSIHQWKNPTLSPWQLALEHVTRLPDKAGERLIAAPAIGPVLQGATAGLLGLSNDLAQSTIRIDAILKDYHAHGHPNITHLDDIWRLDLEQVDNTIGYLGTKYGTLAGVEGAAAGVGGLPAIPLDLVALIGLSMRAIGEYAAYCGFDPNKQEERLFALNILSLSSSATDWSKQIAMAQLVRIGHDVAKKRAWKELERHAFVVLIQQIAKACGIRLTKAKLAQILPVFGAAVGSGYNAYFISKICQAAHHLYRERFLAAKYGAEMIHMPVQPASTFSEGYDIDA